MHRKILRIFLLRNRLLNWVKKDPIKYRWIMFLSKSLSIYNFSNNRQSNKYVIWILCAKSNKQDS